MSNTYGKTSKKDFYDLFTNNEKQQGVFSAAGLRKSGIRLPSYLYSDTSSYDIIKEIISICQCVIEEMKDICTSRFNYTELISYLAEEGINISSHKDFQKIYRFWQDKLYTDKMRVPIEEINNLCKLGDPNSDEYSRYFIRIFACVYIAIAADMENDIHCDTTDYLELLVVTVAAKWDMD